MFYVIFVLLLVLSECTFEFALVGCIQALTKDVELEINHISVAKKELPSVSYFLAI